MARPKKSKNPVKKTTVQAVPKAEEKPVPLEIPSIAAERGRFIIEKSLGRGGVCEVHEALDLLRAGLDDTQPKVALKKLRPEFRDQPAACLALAREFIKTRALAHPGVIQVYELHQHEGELCLSMELIQAPTLKERLRRGPEIATADALVMAGKILQIVAHIHERGLVHADLKPGNIFLKAGQPIIFDFNSAIAVHRPGQPASLQALAESNSFQAGTPVYAAPERLLGEPPTQAGDIFSVAVTIYEIFSGHHPFGRRPATDAANEGFTKPGKPPLLGRRHWRYLEAALSFDPAKRPTAEDWARVYSNGKAGGHSLCVLLLGDLRYLALNLYKRVLTFSWGRAQRDGA